MTERIEFDDAFVSVPSAVRSLTAELPELVEDGYLVGDLELEVTGSSKRTSRTLFFPADTSINDVKASISERFDSVESFECKFYPYY